MAIIVAAAAALAPLVARGDGASPAGVPTKARQLADRGRALHDAGDYSDAITAFTQAYVIAPSPALLFNLAQAYRLLGNCDDAALMYRRYLATNPAPEQRTLAETHLASVERCLHKLALRIPIASASQPAIVPPPPRAVAATASPTATSHRAQLEKDVGLGLMIGGGVSLAIATYYAVQAHDAEGDVAAGYTRGAKWRDLAPADERGKSASTAAQLFGAGGALGVTGGLVTYLLGRHHEHAPAMVASSSRHGAQVGVRWAF